MSFFSSVFKASQNLEYELFKYVSGSELEEEVDGAKPRVKRPVPFEQLAVKQHCTQSFLTQKQINSVARHR
jgi:hypothetical protein